MLLANWAYYANILSGLLALTTLGLYAIRFVNRHNISGYDWVADNLGHTIHGIFMPYMVLVMLMYPALMVPPWIAWFFFFLFILFGVRWLLVMRVNWLKKEPIFGFEAKAIWWWDPVHAGIHLYMAYMFISIRYWNDYFTAAGIVFMIMIVSLPNFLKGMKRFQAPPSPARLYSLAEFWGHVSMGLSMALMLAAMQWGMFGDICSG